MGRVTEAIKHLLIINVLFFLATALYGDLMRHWFSLWFPINENFGLWQVLTHMFMHGGLMHILFNMYGLWAFGTPLERMWGRNKFLFFYFSAGLGSALLYTAMNYYQFNEGITTLVNAGFSESSVLEVLSEGKYNTGWYEIAEKGTIDSFLNAYGIPMLGASGAVYGVLVAFAFSYPETELMLLFLPVPIKAKFFVPLLILGDVIFGITGAQTGIAHFAHIGGALAGFIMVWYWKRNQFNNKRWN